MTDRVPATPPAARVIFGDRLGLAERYVGLLATTGIDHGLIGPREGPRLWDRHVLNCAVAAPLVDPAATVADLGSGAGLPGLVLAIARPDLRLHLVEPLHRRIVWLESTVRTLGLDHVELHEGRAQAWSGRLRVRHTTARAVARLAKLGPWSAPLLEPGGSLVALKGAGAQTELEQDWPQLRRAGAVRARVELLGADLLEEPTRAVVVSFGPAEPGRPRGPGQPG